jgi:hypothetical protein
MVVACAFFWICLWYDDIMPQQGDAPPSNVENVFAGICVVILWPLAVVEKMFGHDPNSRTLMLALLFATGLSWGFILELILRLAARRKPSDALKQTGSG